MLLKSLGLAALGLTLTFGAAAARDTYVHGYVKKDGTYVEPHYRTAPDNTILNNYSTRPNINPYTGKEGTVDPYAPKPVRNPYGTHNP